MTGFPVDFVAVDLGASSGRVIHGRIDGGRLRAQERHRFGNGPVKEGNSLRWDFERLVAEVELGLSAVARDGITPASIGVDSWAVDHGLLDIDGTLLHPPFHYRDPRNEAARTRLRQRLGAAEHYAATGVQDMPFNTVHQLVAEQSDPDWARVAKVVLIPDLIAHRLGAELHTEFTNASTTAMLDVRTGDWSEPVLQAAGLDMALFPPLVHPGSVTGVVDPAVVRRTGLRACPLTAVGSHDTASAVYAVPAADEDWAYVSLGTWALVGVELPGPFYDPRTQAAGYSHERGVGGTVRLLRNVMGLWMLQQSVAAWDFSTGGGDLLIELLRSAADHPSGTLVDPDDPVFVAPGDMTGRIVQWCHDRGLPPPRGRVAIVRCIVDSLAAAIARALVQATELTGRPVRTLHVVGGGARNTLLCQAIADRTGVEVVAGPVEATALGNLLVQAQAVGAVTPGADRARAVVRDSTELIRHRPRAHPRTRPSQGSVVG